GVSPFGRLVAQARPRLCLGPKGGPGKEALTPGLFLPERTRTLSCAKQQQPTDPTLIAQRTLSFRRGFRPEADGASLLLSSLRLWAFGLSRQGRSVARQSVLPWPCCSRPGFGPWVPRASPMWGDAASSLLQPA
ncbi:unnamed protein product, partial [Soboliphyme baturini]|uniref:Integron gene cassette protein n=1 Tax=Soboliphyme baturini TaxID=241478 RepID=A0A183IAR1_9BILA